MNAVQSEATSAKHVGTLPAEPMSLQEFIQNFKLPPIVSIKKSCEVQGCGHSKLYELRKSGKLRIVPRAGGTGVPVEDHYRLYLEALAS
ncbi:MAG: hypothetical protein H0V72_17625 [Bradyrhizobium sp.]|nr:hypothetical protein [Bradyrhizobium sp.]